MQNNAAVFRTGPILREGCQLINDIYAQMDDLHVCHIIAHYQLWKYYSFHSFVTTELTLSIDVDSYQIVDLYGIPIWSKLWNYRIFS